MKLEDFADFEQGELVLVNWYDIQEHGETCEHVRATTSPSKSVGWFDEVYYGNEFHPSTATLAIIKEYRGEELDKQAFPLGCVMNVVRLTEKVRSVI